MLPVYSVRDVPGSYQQSLAPNVFEEASGKMLDTALTPNLVSQRQAFDILGRDRIDRRDADFAEQCADLTDMLR